MAGSGMRLRSLGAIAVTDPAEAAKKADELAKVKAAQANTSAAAKSILEKYLKRPRS